MKTIVVVGGGAGGLELVTRLGRKLGRRKKARIILVDRISYHVWKPLLHEVGVGTLNVDIDGVDFRAQGLQNHFEFQLGSLTSIDRENQTLQLAPVTDESGEMICPERSLAYDILVLALGSVTNDFGTPGVWEHCHTLDTTWQADQFHKRLLNEFLKIQSGNRRETLNVAIVGAGATGVELTAELFRASEWLSTYGYHNSGRGAINIKLIEAGPRILPALPEHIANRARRHLEALGAKVYTDTKIASASADALVTDKGEHLTAQLKVWAAGVKAPALLAGIGGLQTNKINQLQVNPYLQTTLDERILALGDCVEHRDSQGNRAPPRAQTAHQMASLVYRNILATLADKPLKAFIYRDHGSLVSLADYSAVGMISGMANQNWFVEGRLARLFYVSLYRLHQVALYGYVKTGLLMLVGRINRSLRPRLKLH